MTALIAATLALAALLVLALQWPRLRARAVERLRRALGVGEVGSDGIRPDATWTAKAATGDPLEDVRAAIDMLTEEDA